MYQSPYLMQLSQPTLGQEDLYKKQTLDQQYPDLTPVYQAPAASPVVVQKSQGVDPGQVGTSAMTGAAVGGPAGAAVAAGGSLLSQYVAQKAADERARREGVANAYAKNSSDEQNILNTIMASNTRALR